MCRVCLGMCINVYVGESECEGEEKVRVSEREDMCYVLEKQRINKMI